MILKISEFAEKNNVTTKMLRHYDDIGLLKPHLIDKATGYRIYSEEQSKQLHWIVILKFLDFSLKEIKEVLESPVNGELFLNMLKGKRIEAHEQLNVRLLKKMQIDRLINILEREGFDMNKEIDLTKMSDTNVNEIKRNMPNTEMFLEKARDILAMYGNVGGKKACVMRLDLDHFKSVNDEYGYEVGDRVILFFYEAFVECVAKHNDKHAAGRIHGDEFIAYFINDVDAVRAVHQDLADKINGFDFSTIGCNKKLSCSVGAAVRDVGDYNIREFLDASIGALSEAKKNRSNRLEIVFV